MKRREFLRNSGWFVVGAAVVPGCVSESDNVSESSGAETDAAARFRFPQGLASGDPRAASVVLWTRVVPATGNPAAPVRLRVQVATDARCDNRVVDREIVATEASDHTVRVLVTGLRPATRYHYRFVAGRDTKR